MQDRGKASIWCLLLAGCLFGTVACTLLGPAPQEISFPGPIALPRLVSEVLYRSMTPGGSLTSLRKLGTLQIGRDEILFRHEALELRIPMDTVSAVRWGKIGLDPANDWAVIQYAKTGKVGQESQDDESDESEVQTAAFREGGKAGSGAGTGHLFSALKYAVFVAAGKEPTVTSARIHSGWVELSDVVLQRVPAGGLQLMVEIHNKCPQRVQVAVRFSPPGEPAGEPVRALLEPGERQHFAVDLAEILPLEDYFADVDVYTVQGRPNLVDRNRVQLRFDPQQTEGFQTERP